MIRENVHAPEACPHCGAPSSPRLLVAHIQATVAAYYKISVRHMTSDRRDWEFSHPRQVAMYLAAELTPKSYPDIGRLFHRDHSTVIFAEKAVQLRMCKHPEIAADVCALRTRLGGPVETGDIASSTLRKSHEDAKEQTVKTQAERLAA